MRRFAAEGTTLPTQSSSAVTLEEWSDRLARGDRAALTEMYRRYAAAATGVAYAILRRRDEADEVVQQTFLDVWQSASHYDPRRSSPRTWITSIAKARAVDRLRTRYSEEGALRGLALEPDSPRAQQFSDTGKIRRAVNALPAEQARVVGLAYYRGLTHREISDETGVPVGTTKTRMRLAMFRLVAAMADPHSSAAP